MKIICLMPIKSKLKSPSNSKTQKYFRNIYKLIFSRIIIKLNSFSSKIFIMKIFLLNQYKNNLKQDRENNKYLIKKKKKILKISI